MRKLLALTLAVAMVLSLASVAFAANMVVLKDDEMYDEDGAPVNTSKTFEGDEVYFAIRNGSKAIVDDDVAKTLKVSAEWEMGEEFVKSVELVKEKYDANKAQWCVKVSFDFPENEVDTEDVIGTLTFNAKKKTIDDVVYEKNDDQEVNFAITLGNETNDDEKTFSDGKVYKFESAPLKDQDECEIALFDKEEVGTFTVDTHGQKNLVIAGDIKYSEGIEAITPDIAYTYYRTNNPTFNKLGTLVLKANEGDVLYELDGDELVKSDAKYDADEEGFVIRTRTIGSYVIAEAEMVAEVVAPEVPANPSTGAAC